MKIRSWKQELDDKYEQLTGGGDIHIIYRANDIILKAIEELDKIRRAVQDEDI